MLRTADWHPVVPAHMLGQCDRLLATRVLGQDLVVWRSLGGVAQVWRDRCPHRGVRLSLGRILGGRLSCAYHGWEFAPDSGRCEAIPALADLVQLPGQIRASVSTATESRQMVWVHLPTDPDAPAAPAPAARPAKPTPHRFLRSLGIDTGLERVQARLQQHGFEPDGQAAWAGTLADQPVCLFLQALQGDKTVVHAWACAPPVDTQLADLFAALRRLRSDAESAVG